MSNPCEPRTRVEEWLAAILNDTEGPCDPRTRIELWLQALLEKGGGDADAVHYTADTGKTDVQKGQARSNIGAGSDAKLTEVEAIAKGAQAAISYSNYSAFVTAFNALDDTAYNVGQSVMIVTLEVPDLWVMSVEATSVPYTYVDDATIISALLTTGYIQVGYYKIAALETSKVDLTEYVRVDAAQAFSAAQKIQARTNIGAISAPEQVTSGTAITLADNTEYRLTDVTTLAIAFPVGNFDAWMRITTASSGTVAITLPVTASYIGTAPVFANSETWELSIKDGVVVAGKVTA